MTLRAGKKRQKGKKKKNKRKTPLFTGRMTGRCHSDAQVSRSQRDVRRHPTTTTATQSSIGRSVPVGVPVSCMCVCGSTPPTTGTSTLDFHWFFDSPLFLLFFNEKKKQTQRIKIEWFFFAIPRLERLAFLLFFNSHQSLLGFFDSFFYSKESNISSVSPFIDSETVLFFLYSKENENIQRWSKFFDSLFDSISGSKRRFGFSSVFAFSLTRKCSLICLTGTRSFSIRFLKRNPHQHSNWQSL